MKYIKTKYGIYNAIKRRKIGDMICPSYVGLTKVIAEADTIEELCDEFILIDKNEYDPPIKENLIGERYRAMFDEFKFRLSEGSDIKKMSFYGAVWTDKGLTYVAKMNDKGEFELL